MKGIKKLLNTWTKRIVAIVVFLILVTWIILFFNARKTALDLIVPILLTFLIIGVSWLAIHFGVKAWRKRKRSEFDEAIVAKEGIEDRRREWSNWTEELEKQGIDRYELPFYLLVGEPQSGKSVLLHNSDLHFPFGQNRLSGVGGTRGCDWWFTEEAVILDLAGRLFTHEGGASDRLEFESFLELLYEFRPLCPANGVILVIPCDSLLQDDEEQCGLKATKIQNALLTVTTKLQAQLPVYLVLTKGDQIFGFAESVHRLDVERRHQMFGWSRPADKIDTPFDVTEVTNGFEELVRRAQLLRANMGAGARLPEALPEIDRMYAFPHELAGMQPNLEIYLNRIFTASNIIDRVFFRGMYLTSGLQTGVPIAKVCTELFGQAGEADRRDLQALFNKQRAYFIKDLIRNRVFGERGLVRPTQGRVQQTRRSSVVGFGISGALVLTSLIFSGSYLMKEVQAQRADIYADALESARDSLVEELGMNALLTAAQKIADAQREPVDSAERAYFDPSEEFKPLYRKIFDERVLPEVMDSAISQIEVLINREFGSFDDLTLVCEALMPLLEPTVDFSVAKVREPVLALLEERSFQSRVVTEGGGVGLSLGGAFEQRQQYGGSMRKMLIEATTDQSRRLAGCAKGVLRAVEACVAPGSRSQPGGACGYMLAWYEAEKASEILNAANILTSKKALAARSSFYHATERMDFLKANEIESAGAGKPLKWTEAFLPLRNLGVEYQKPLAQFVAESEGTKASLWPFMGEMLGWAQGKFEPFMGKDGGVLSQLGINFGGNDAQITFFEKTEEQLAMVNSEIILGVDLKPMELVDKPDRLRDLCREDLLPESEGFTRLGRRINDVAQGTLEATFAHTDIFKIFQAQLLEIGVLFQAQLKSAQGARALIVPGDEDAQANSLSPEFVDDLSQLHESIGTLITARKIENQRGKLEDWQRHIEELLHDHLNSSEGALGQWAPTIPDRGDLTPEMWEVLKILGNAADTTTLVQKDSQSGVCAQAGRVQNLLFMHLADQFLARWDGRDSRSVSDTQATVDDLKILTTQVSTKLALAETAELLNWGRNVDEVISGRLIQLQAKAEEVWEPRGMTGSLESAIQTAEQGLLSIQEKIQISKNEGLQNLGAIVAALDGTSMPTLALAKTTEAALALSLWKIPLSVQGVRNSVEYTSTERILRSLNGLSADARRRGTELATIYKNKLFNLSAVERMSANAGVQMVRKIRNNLAEQVRREIQRSFLTELSLVLNSRAYDEFFKALFWKPEDYVDDKFIYDDKEIAQGLNDFFGPRDGEYFNLRLAFQLVTPDGAIDIGNAIFPPDDQGEDLWEQFHHFLRDFETFLLGEKRISVEDVTIDFTIIPAAQEEQTVWDNLAGNRGAFHYPVGGTSKDLTYRRVGAEMKPCTVSDWGFRTSRSDRGMTFLWSKLTDSKLAISDRTAWRFKTPTCLAPMILAWLGKPRRDDDLTEYTVEFTPDGTTLPAPMRLLFENDLPPRPRRRP